MPHAGSIPKQVPWKNSARLLAKQDNQYGAPLANWDVAHLVRSKEKKMEADCVIFFGARIRLGTILGRFSINYFSGLGLRNMVRVWVRVRVRVNVGDRVSVVTWSG